MLQHVDEQLPVGQDRVGGDRADGRGFLGGVGHECIVGLYAVLMTEQQQQETTPAGGGLAWLDWSAAVAAVLLLVIAADIFSGGRLISARLARWRGGADGDVAGGTPGD